MNKITILLSLTMVLAFFSGCKKGGTGVLFPLSQDVAMGAQVDEQIRTSGEFNILDESSNVAAYAYLNTMKDQILNGGEVKFKDEFVWKLAIIDDPKTLNAFCTPGGYIYVYTGLIKYLDNSSSLAGVMGHEIAHADRRHSSKQMQQQFGINTLLSILSGAGDNAALIGNVAASLTNLAFSRSDENEADEYSVKYLCATTYDAAGAANFFQKIVNQGDSSTTAFMSTHPAPLTRVSKIQENADSKDCGEETSNPLINGVSYKEFQDMFRD